jgi:hypothetical protein
MSSLAARISDLAAAVRTKINAIMPRLLPPGGATSAVLRKASPADNSVEWWTPRGDLFGVNQQPGVAYTLALTDAGCLVDRVNAAANTVTVPAATDVAFPIGSRIPVRQGGAGQTSIVAASGVTIQSAGGKLKIAEQFAAAELVKVGADTWWLVGALAA